MSGPLSSQAMISKAGPSGGKPGQTMGATGRSTILGALALIVGYQVVYQLFLGSLLQQEQQVQQDDEVCSAALGSAATPRCLESQLFRSWQQASSSSAAANEAGKLGAGDTEEYLESLLQAEAHEEGTKHERDDDDHRLRRPAGRGVGSSKTTAPGSSSVEDAETLLTMARSRQDYQTATPRRGFLAASGEAQLDASLHAQADRHRVWEKNVVSQIESYVHELCADPSRRGDAPCVRLLEGAGDLPAASPAPAAVGTKSSRTDRTPWARDLVALQAQLESRLKEREAHSEERALRHHAREALYGSAGAADEVFSSEGSKERSNETRWAHELWELKEQMQKRMEEREVARERRAATREAAKDSTTSGKEATEEEEEEAVDAQKPLLEERIYALGRKLCSEPQRQGSPPCARFLGNKSSEERPSRAPLAPGRAAGRAALAGEEEVGSPGWYEAKQRELARSSEERWSSFNQEVNALGRELCSGLHSRDDPSCARFLANLTATSSDQGAEEDEQPARAQAAPPTAVAPAASSLRGAANRPAARGQPSGLLQWPAAAAWGRRKLLKGESGGMVLERGQLAMARWNGRLPKVACIALIPSGRHVEEWLKHFIQNFRLQSYEGPTELVLVYHFTNREVRGLLEVLADGVRVKGVPARGDFPSAAAFRYGAWRAHDADVVARWDFDAVHHPTRLAMQVGALALSARPGCLLESWTVWAGGVGGVRRAESEGARWDGTLVGEARWMREHWFPYLPEEHEALNSLEARDLVRVRYPELATYVEGQEDEP